MLDWICFAYRSSVHNILCVHQFLMNTYTYETSYVLHGIIPFMSIDRYLEVSNTVMLAKDYES